MESKLQQVPQKAQTNKPNLTGIPTQMKLDFEQRSGLSFDDVRVHYNSDKPAQLQALAYTQGTQVYVGPGQERHLKHELGHVVQQKYGNVHPTCYINGLPINDQSHFEREADILWTSHQNYQFQSIGKNAPIQRKINIAYNSTSITPWDVRPVLNERPKFSAEVAGFFVDVFSAKDLGYNATRSIDHVISYKTITLLICGILFEKLNNGSKKMYRGSPIMTSSPSSPTRTTKITSPFLGNMLKFTVPDWYDLIRLIIPKKTDYVVLHNLWEMESMIHYAMMIYNDAYLRALVDMPSFEERLIKLFNKKNNYTDVLERQRDEALQIVSQITNDLSGSVVVLPIIKNEAEQLETLLNNSVGNLRLGDSSTNSSIGSSLDPFAHSFALKQISQKNYQIIFDDQMQQVEGYLEDSSDPARSFAFHSKQKSMAKRVQRLLKLNQKLMPPSGIRNNALKTFPTIDVAYCNDPEITGLQVYSSDTGLGTKSKTEKFDGSLQVVANHLKKNGNLVTYTATIGNNEFLNITQSVNSSPPIRRSAKLGPLETIPIIIYNPKTGDVYSGSQKINRYTIPDSLLRRSRIKQKKELLKKLQKATIPTVFPKSTLLTLGTKKSRSAGLKIPVKKTIAKSKSTTSKRARKR